MDLILLFVHLFLHKCIMDLFQTAAMSSQVKLSLPLSPLEPIAEQPVLNGSSTWHNLNQSCTVLLECSAHTGSSVSYNWTVRNQTISGSRLQYVIKMQDGDTTFTCTAYNFVSEMSESRIMKCSNDTEESMCREVVVVYCCSIIRR